MDFENLGTADLNISDHDLNAKLLYLELSSIIFISKNLKIICSLDGEILNSESSYKLFGENNFKAKNNSIYDFVFPDDDNTLNILFSVIKKQSTICNQIIRFLKNKNDIIYFSFNSFTFIDQANSNYFVIANDITSKVFKNEEAEILFSAINHSSNGILITNALGYVEYLNDAFSSNINKEMSEIRNKNIFTNSFYLSLEKKQKIIKELEVTDNWRIQVSIVFPNSSAKTFQITFSVLRDNYGKIKNYIQEVHDVSELKSQYDQSISTVSHELRTPISIISQSLHNILRYDQKLTTDEKEKLLKMGYENSNVLSEIIDDLLILSQIDYNKIELMYITINLNEIINDLVRQFKTRLDAKELTLEFNQGNDKFIKGDYKRISQILRILIDNAIKYSSDKNKIQINVHSKIIENEVKGLIVDVVDFGVGIPQEDLKFIFTRFFRAKNALFQKGTGLGLSIAQNLVELHHGSISVHSVENLGSTFSIFLPVMNNDSVN